MKKQRKEGENRSNTAIFIYNLNWSEEEQEFDAEEPDDDDTAGAGHGRPGLVDRAGVGTFGRGQSCRVYRRFCYRVRKNGSPPVGCGGHHHYHIRRTDKRYFQSTKSVVSFGRESHNAH